MTIKAFVYMTSVLLCFFPSAKCASWSYSGNHGPSNWYKEYPICNNNRQSPINIYEGDVVPNAVTEPFIYTNYDNKGVNMEIGNNGHSATVTLSGSNLPTISGGGLPGTFEAAQFHFHWAEDENMGSEHLISSEQFPIELHIVHYNKKYSSINEAINKTDGLAVLGFMLEISGKDNPAYSDLVSGLSKITEKGSKASLSKASMGSFLPTSYNRFFRYLGSLTTPDCFESVTWTVFKDYIKISRDQLSKFLKLKDDYGNKIVTNVRPVMPLNGRQVQANFDSEIPWTYNTGHYDVAHWPSYYESCGGESQSPVNIPTSLATTDSSLGTFTFNNFDSKRGITMKLKNDGYGVKVTPSGSVISVSGGGLPGTYNVAQFHFHWGSTSMKGSEHTLDAEKFPMEVHIVTYKASLGSIGNALKQPEGLAVLGFFFEISESDNTDMNSITNALKSIIQPKSEVDFEAITLNSFLPADRKNFFRYPGSLTTPGCYESVIWSVFESKIKISEFQMDKFRRLKSVEKDENMNYLPMVNNYRPVLSLNSRVLKANFAVQQKTKKGWTYFGTTGTQNWAQLFPTCGSPDRQSPIDFKTTEVEHMKIPSFDLHNFDTKSDVSLKMTNDGHTVTVEYLSGNLRVSGGGLGNVYKVAQFHLHWGSVNSQGSEHTIDGKKYPMELHIVTYNEQYNNIGLAMTQPNGLAVLGFMFQLTEKDNPKLEPMLKSLPKIYKPKTEVSIETFTLNSILPNDKSEFFRYDGSLTTPGCDESVTWTVFYNTILISQKQLNMFRDLESVEIDDVGNKMMMVDNFRPVQEVGQRNVYSNFYLSGAPTTQKTAPAVLSVMFTLGRIVWNFN